MKKMCVLFGAGAEIGLGVSGGKDFAYAVTGSGKQPDVINMTEAIKSFYSQQIENSLHKEWCEKFEKTTVEEKNLIEASVRNKYLQSDDPYHYKKDMEDAVKEKTEQLLKDTSEEERDKFLSDYTSYMGLIDEKFHTIIYPKVLGVKNFSTVLSFYTRAYLRIVTELLGYDRQDVTKELCINLLSDPRGTYNAVKEAVQKSKDKKSYYSCIKAVLDQEKDNQNIKIITTNYTPLCSIHTELPEDKIAYLHGKIGWFEVPYELKVYDVSKDEEELPNELYFPYVFIQSGIKPIVEQREIKEYAKMIQFLEESDKLIIVGFRLNADDIHINGVVRSFLEKKQVIYLNYDKDVTKENLCRKLRIRDSLNLIFEHIDNSNCYSMFRKYLES